MSKTLPARDMLALLRTSTTPNLTALEIDYNCSDEDEMEDALSRCICEAFPLLERLSIHRYRPWKRPQRDLDFRQNYWPDPPDVDVVRICPNRSDASIDRVCI